MEIDYNRLFEKYPNANREDLIPLMQDIQDKVGYLSEDAIRKLGNYLKLPTAKIYGLATFYNQFRLKPGGKYHIEVCDGTSCHIENSKSILNEFEKILNIKPGEISRNGLFSLQTVPCLGACGIAPVICINGEFISKVTPESIPELIEKITLQES